MTNWHTSRLIVATAASVLSVGLLFSGISTSSAQKKTSGDRSAPTAPTNLVVTAITETTIEMSWGPSTDNSGQFSYKVRINNLDNSQYNTVATVSQSQTTYTARFLAPNSRHTLAVYAVDLKGNQSADSNSVSAKTLADRTPPGTPTLEATVLAPSKVQLTWTRTTDNIPLNCCSYTFVKNGSPTTEHINWGGGTADTLSVTIRHLIPATSYTFSVNVLDFYGNVAASNPVTVTTEASSDTVAPTAPTNLHLVRYDGALEVWLGWIKATDDVDPQEQIEYEIYVNGVLSPLPVSAGVDVDFVYATIFGDNTFEVRAVDRSGNTSAPSNALTLFLQ